VPPANPEIQVLGYILETWSRKMGILAKPPSGGEKSGTVPMDLANGPSVFAALQEQLGLRLEPRKVPTEVLVIGHAEKASEN
jgi:uncharacterized protein (TIGR03435 family)